MGKNNIPYKVSEESLAFLRKINEHAHEAGHIPFIHISYDDLIKTIHQFFKLDNEAYLKLLKIVGKMEEQKNGS